jgi:hypothetical protein
MTNMLGISHKKVGGLVEALTSETKTGNNKSAIKKTGRYGYSLEKIRAGSVNVHVLMGKNIRVTSEELARSAQSGGDRSVASAGALSEAIVSHEGHRRELLIECINEVGCILYVIDSIQVHMRTHAWTNMSFCLNSTAIMCIDRRWEVFATTCHLLWKSTGSPPTSAPELTSAQLYECLSDSRKKKVISIYPKKFW